MEIKNRFNGKIIYISEKKIMKEAVEEAIQKKADLSSADLSWADLSSAHTWKTEFYRCKVTKREQEAIYKFFNLEVK